MIDTLRNYYCSLHKACEAFNDSLGDNNQYLSLGFNVFESVRKGNETIRS